MKLNTDRKTEYRFIIALVSLLSGAGLFALMVLFLLGGEKLSTLHGGSDFFDAVRSGFGNGTPEVHDIAEDAGLTMPLIAAGSIALIIALTLLFYFIMEKRREFVIAGILTVAITSVTLLSLGNADTFSALKAKSLETRDSIADEISASRYDVENDSMTMGNFSRISVEMSENACLIVDMEEPGQYYLHGFRGEVYNGNGWSGLDRETLEENNGLFYWLDKDGYNENGLVVDGIPDTCENLMTIQNVGTNSRYAYIPYEMTAIFGTEGDDTSFSRYIGDANFGQRDDRNGRNREYAVSAVKYKGEKLEELRRAASESENRKNREDEYNYRKFAYDNYLDVPDSAKADIEGLLEEYGETAGTSSEQSAGEYNPVDTAKLLILEALSDFEYNEKRTYTSQDGEFLKKFVEEKEGSSVHFATVAALMFRTMGIPSRFAEGYLITDGEKKSQVLTGEDYHAWAEYYEDGVGWIPFEAVMELENLMPGSDYEIYRQAELDISETRENTDAEEMVNAETGSMQNPEEPQDMDTDCSDRTKKGTWLPVTIMLLIFAGTGLLIFRYLLNERKKHDRDVKRAIIFMMGQIDKAHLKKPEILSETDYKRAYRIYEEARFSNHEMGENERSEMLEIYKATKSLNKKPFGSKM